jgi:hypothetical protein
MQMKSKLGGRKRKQRRSTLLGMPEQAAKKKRRIWEL